MDAHVIVVGAGPVGLLLAGELRAAGLEAIVLERRDAPMTESRASTLHARAMGELVARGVLQDAPRERTGHFAGMPLDFGDVPGTHPGLWKVPQTDLEKRLADRAVALGADVRRGHEVTAFTQTAGHVEVDGLRAHHLVGCDGHDSTVRRLAGIPMAGRPAARELLRADVAGIDVPNRRFERLPGGLAIAARRPDGVTRVMVHEYGTAPAARTGPPSFDEVVKAWARVTGEDIGDGDPLWVNAFHDACLQAVRYRQGRVLLAGDAAHVQLPVGGQALNLGLLDAVSLARRLVAAGDDPAALDAYHDERHPAGARALTDIQAQALLLLGGPEADAVRAVFGELLRMPRVQAHLTTLISGGEPS